MAWITPDRDTIVERFFGALVVRTQETAALIWAAAQRVLAEVFGAALLDLYAWMANEVLQFTIQTAEGDYLDKKGVERGIARLSANAADGVLVFSGTVAATQILGSTLTREDGVEYVTTALATVGGAGTGTVTFDASVTGAGGNCDSGTVLTWASPSAGIDPTGTVQDDISSGLDEETDDNYRERLLSNLASPPQGGDLSDYVDWTKATPSVSVGRAYAFAYPHLTVGYVNIRFMVVAVDGTESTPDPGEVTAVDNYVQPLKTGGTALTIEAPLTDSLDPTIELHVLAGYVEADVQAAMSAGLAAYLVSLDISATSYVIRNSQIRDALNVYGIDYFILSVLNGGAGTSDVTLAGYTVGTVGAIIWSP